MNVNTRRKCAFNYLREKIGSVSEKEKPNEAGGRKFCKILFLKRNREEDDDDDDDDSNCFTFSEESFCEKLF